MTGLVNHPGMWLNPEAAAALARFEKAHGKIPINSAGRTVATQNGYIHRYYVIGGPSNRPPYLYAPARPAETSDHVKNGGQAIDTDRIALMLKYGKDFGWIHPYDWDHVHFEYDKRYDKHLTAAPKPARPVVRLGSRGSNVSDLQKILTKYHKAKLKADGVFGSGTLKAVKAFQKKAKLAQDGIVGERTWKALGQ